MKKIIAIFMILSCGIIFAQQEIQRFCICTAANNGYINPLLSLIGGLHKYDFDLIEEIAVFDLGLSPNNIAKLTTIEKVKIHQIEKTHPDILKSFKTRKGGKWVPGWYAWKPVAVKQMLDIYPYILWVDAGTTVNKSLADLFEHIKYKGYFFLNTYGQKLAEHATQFLKNKFDLNNPKLRWALNTIGLQPGFAGYTKVVYDSIVLPAYELTKDLRNYADDRTAPGGFGNARHDQSVISLLVILNKLKIHYSFMAKQQEAILELPEGSATFGVKNNGHIWFTRDKHNVNYFGQFIRYKKTEEL